MRHKVAHRKLGRSPAHRHALLRNMCTQLIEHERITTTTAKAKWMRPFMEKIMHKAKRGTNADMNFLYKTLYKTSMVAKVRDEIAPRFKDLPAGFTRIEFLGNRLNDKASVSMIELIGNEIAEF